MMGSRSSKGMLFAGIIGAVAGMYVLNMLDGSRTERRVRYQSRNLARRARNSADRMGHMYKRGKSAIQEGMQGLYH